MNYPLMRMAEVRLQYAEALYFTGDEPGARKQFDPVRERILGDGASLEKLNEAYYRRISSRNCSRSAAANSVMSRSARST